jgi:uridine kinase
VYKVEIKIDGRHHNSVVYPRPMTVAEIFTDNDLVRFTPMVFKLGAECVNRSREISRDARLDCVSYATFDGQRIYQDTAIFIMMKAFRRIFPPELKLVVQHSIGDGVYCRITDDEDHDDNADATQETALRLKDEIRRIVGSGLPIEARKMTIPEARTLFEGRKRRDILLNLEFLDRESITLFKCGDYYDYYIRQLAESTACISHFDVLQYGQGFILRFPDRIPNTPEGKLVMREEASYHQKLFEAHREHERWLGILGVRTVGEINTLIRRYDVADMIHVEEALHEKKLAAIADLIQSRPAARLVLIAGPSSSGKTTFAKRLSIQLRVNGKRPLVIGMDDYFQPRSLTPKKPGGEYDYECIDALDLKLLNDHLTRLLNGEEVTLPKYNFHTGMREEGHNTLRMEENHLLVLEGIHGLNDRLTASIPASHKVMIYVSPLNQLNIDRHNRIPTTDIRKIRRMVRDSRYRGYSAEQTLVRWDSIREGEEIYIFPYQENADAMFNSSLTYELGVLKKHAMPLLTQISEFSPVYLEAQRLIQLLAHFRDIEDFFVPSNSILREFTFASIFKY